MQEEEKDGNGFKDLTIDGVKALFPDFGAPPLVSVNSDSRNPGVRLITNDDKLDEMLKIVHFPDEEMARNIAGALSECGEFLLNPDGKVSKEVQQRINDIKNLCAAMCSVKGMWADLYKQTAIGVATTAVTERGATLLNLPIGKPQEHKDDNKNGGRKG